MTFCTTVTQFFSWPIHAIAMGKYAIAIKTYASRLGGPRSHRTCWVIYPNMLPLLVLGYASHVRFFFVCFLVRGNQVFPRTPGGMRFLYHTAEWVASAHRIFSRSAWCSMPVAHTRPKSQRLSKLTTPVCCGASAVVRRLSLPYCRRCSVNSWLVNSPPQPNQKPEVLGF